MPIDFQLARNINAANCPVLTCKQCGGRMKEGIAIMQSLTGRGDFHDADNVVTMSAGDDA